jgi:predicted  nucleic acid-binding Zn-ribbon protein
LSRCEFVEAEKQLVTFERNFGPVLREIDESLESPARRQRVYHDLVARAQSIERLEKSAEQGEPTPDSLLLALVAADPEFYRLHAQIRALDAELSSTGNSPAELSALALRVQGKDAPAPRLSEADEASPRDAIGSLRREIDAAKGAIDAFSEQLSQLSRAGADKGELRALYEVKKQLDRRVDDVAQQLREALAHADDTGAAPSARELSARLLEDRAYVEALQSRALKLRAGLETAASEAGERALRGLRERLAKELRRARIGRIDAVMGSKRQVELQVESLAAGRFPPELTDPLRMQSLLRDDEEYWPFEGEDWPDEFVERYAEDEE